LKYSILGSTGIAVSRLCFGTLTMGPLQKNLPLSQGVRLLESAFSQGVNFLDTAEIYGTYPFVKEALRILPDAVVCTKSYSYDTITAQASFRKAVEGIGREYIDIFLLHEQESQHTIRGHWEAVEYFLKKKREGYIGAIGLSTHHIAAVEGANRYPELDIVFPLINQAGIGIADGTGDEMLKRINEAHALGKGVIAMKPLGGGHLIRERKEALQYVLNQPAIHTIAIGMQSEAEIRYNCAVFADMEPAEGLAESIDAQSRRLMIHDWCVGCGACVKRCRNRALSLSNGKAVVDTKKCALCGYCAGVCPQFCIKVI
jgi:aryl-alcohol dehydrogenase-like predicted oxidoreductase